MNSLKRRAVMTYPRHGVVYLNLLGIREDNSRYVGQINDSHARIIETHESATYRKSQRKILFLLRERADEVFYLPSNR